MAQATQHQKLQAAPPQTPDLTVVEPDHFHDWLEWLEKSKDLSPNTVKLYRRTVEIARVELGDLTTLSTEVLEDWLQRKGGKVGTRNNRICALTSFYSYLRKRKVIAANPCDDLERPRARKGLPKPVKDYASVLEALDASDIKANECGSIPRRVGETRDMVVVLAETGLRIHEAVALNVRVPCPEQIEVLGKGRKEAMILMTDEAREALDRLGGCWPIGARATQRRLEKVGTHPHAFRHYLGCTLAASGADIREIAELLRHSSLETSKIYSHYDNERLRTAQARRRGVTL